MREFSEGFLRQKRCIKGVKVLLNFFLFVIALIFSFFVFSLLHSALGNQRSR